MEQNFLPPYRLFIVTDRGTIVSDDEWTSHEEWFKTLNQDIDFETVIRGHIKGPMVWFYIGKNRTKPDMEPRFIHIAEHFGAKAICLGIVPRIPGKPHIPKQVIYLKDDNRNNTGKISAHS